MTGYLKLSEKIERQGGIQKSVTLYRTPDRTYHAMVVILSPLFLRPDQLPDTFPQTSRDIAPEEALRLFESSQERFVAGSEAFPQRDLVG